MPSTAPQQPWAGPQWPPPWQPGGYPPRPHRDVNWPVAIGGVILLLGYLLFAVGDVIIISLPSTPTYAQVFGAYALAIAGEVTVGVGFFVALLGLAIRR